MIINKSYIFRLYPNDEQKQLIDQTFGCVRFVYNKMLEKLKSAKLNQNELMNELLNLYEQYDFLKKVNSNCLKNAIVNLINNYNRYEKKLSNYPKYKKKSEKESFRISNFPDKNIKIDLKNSIINIPKIGQIKIKGYRNKKDFTSEILNITVKKIGIKYYLSVCVKESLQPKEKTLEKIVGIDLGVKDLIVTSDNQIYHSLNLEKYDKKIAILQSKLSRCKNKSKNSLKIKEQINEAYRKKKNAIKKYNEQIVKELINKNDVIIAEKLQIKTMLKKDHGNKILRKKISSSTFADILTKLNYKCLWENKTFIQINQYYPSSQICSNCGYQNQEMKDLSKRKFECPECGMKKNRDYNASLNILKEGKRILGIN